MHVNLISLVWETVTNVSMAYWDPLYAYQSSDENPSEREDLAESLLYTSAPAYNCTSIYPTAR